MARQVLLCDDEFHILKAAEFKFKKADFDVRLASDGQEAWEMIQESKPDIVITDYQMPRMDGIELAERIHNDPSTTHIPMIMLTAKGFELSHDELINKYGICSVNTKPFSPRALVQQVEDILSPQGAAEA